MIGIVNLNMSLDKIYMVDDFEKGEVTRVKQLIDMAGGKGTHVANICQELGIPYKLIGFLAGPTGEKVKGLLDRDGMHYEFTEVSGDTRICLNIISETDGTQTEFLESGVSVTEEELASFVQSFERLAEESRVIVISGSGYKGMEPAFYGKLCLIAKEKGAEVIIDASGQNLLQSLDSKPTVIKPNKDEVKVLSETGDHTALIQELLAKGISLPIISQGAKGALAGFAGAVYQVTNPPVEAINCVGSGDSFIGGIAIGIHEGYPIEKTLALGCACGTANTLQLESGRVDKEDVNRILQEVRVEKL